MSVIVEEVVPAGAAGTSGEEVMFYTKVNWGRKKERKRVKWKEGGGEERWKEK